ncbi:hypothetical protein [Actinomadura rudentiformis]|uniref:Uncharacterized protein n=1 Tax=Actinomadura rudentiformis TaxID=359158 RepID=A0A6H9YHD7_9ACTN|nr:hypothetical protein [Actinomadura rudentiformis]KAB2341629.1 hypothetical protein F8566_41605 [Actinomadura rudentiformis]
MSDSAIIIVDLSANQESATERATLATAWLVEHAIIVPNEHPDSLFSASRFSPGPNVTAAAPDFHVYPPVHYNGVDIISEPDRVSRTHGRHRIPA